MFNTEINHFLQQFDNIAFQYFMEFISALGTVPFILTVVFGITFALNFKRGVVLVNIIAWTAILTIAIKHQVDFPRPMDVDSSLRTQDQTNSNINLKALQPSSFFSIFSEELLNETRNDELKTYGFPSGHTSIQVGLWLGMFLLFRKRWIFSLGVTVVLLTMLSRLYLAHHFLADVLGGLTLGLLIVGLIALLINKTNYLKHLSPHFKNLSLLWLPAFAIPFVSFVPIDILGSLIGLNLAATFIILQGNTLIFHATLWKRITTAVLIILLVYLSYYLNNLMNYSNNLFVKLFVISFSNFAIIRGSVYFANRFRFLKYKI
ncbi:MAG: phosphatase PAP2 family protein [Flavobacteriales bacterium]|nr:phosphatase PAP2 family protein [Flavobacteriales bacterium]